MLNMNKIIFEVEKPEYAYFCKTINPSIRDIIEEENEEGRVTRVVRKSTGECICQRESFLDGSEEKYYIFSLLHEDEAITPPPEPAHQVILETPQQVQKLLDFLRGQAK